MIGVENGTVADKISQFAHPLTGIFPFTLVRKHILIQLNEKTQKRYRLEKEPYLHAFITCTSEKNNVTEGTESKSLSAVKCTHCFLRQVIGQTLLALKL